MPEGFRDLASSFDEAFDHRIQGVLPCSDHHNRPVRLRQIDRQLVEIRTVETENGIGHAKNVATRRA